MAAIYSNENFPLPAVQELRRLGHDVLTIQETGEAGNALPDDAVWPWLPVRVESC